MEKYILLLKNFINFQNPQLHKIIYTIIIFIILKIIWKIINFLNIKISNNEKQIYTIHKKNKTIFTIIYLLIFFIIWNKELKNVITLISFISAAVTLAARDIIYNYFCGIYIKLIKPFKIEDRIKLDDTIGDIININSLSFELLEVDDNTNQSTGKIIHTPNSRIFSTSIKNYNTAFKYIWDEISIPISPNSNISLAKKILLKIVNSNEIIKDIPKKMKQEIKNCNTNYRIYYNKLSPIIYTKIEENKIILTLRFLIHPKKQRNVESEIYEKLLIEYKKNNITII
ncbi:MAG: mechanosensitive ion channel family protein [Clostridiales bacterium]|nr:mechanosensitive ion channel family protein [Clostridiales bacterium]